MFLFNTVGKTVRSVAEEALHRVRFGPNAAQSTVEVAGKGIVKVVKDTDFSKLVNTSQVPPFPPPATLRFASGQKLLPAPKSAAHVDLSIKPVAVRDITSEVGGLHPPPQEVKLLSPAFEARKPQLYRYSRNLDGDLTPTTLQQPQPYRSSKASGWPSSFANYTHVVDPNTPLTDAVASSTASPSWFARAQAGVRNQARQARAKAGEAAEAVRTATAKASETVGQAVAGAGSSVRNAGTQAANSIQETGDRLRQSIIDHPLRATVAAGSVGFAGGAVVGASGSETL